MFFFDPSKVPDSAYTEGRKKGRITNVDMRYAKSGTGRYLALEIAFGRDGGLVITDRLNVENSNPTAQTIALERLAAVYKSAGLGPCDVECLRGKLVDVELKKSPGSDGKMYLGIEEYYPQQGQQLSGAQGQLRPEYQPQPQQNAQQQAFEPRQQQRGSESDVPF
jgi:hypothetical protein